MAGRNSLFGPVDPALDAGYVDPPPRKGFFTDTSVCIGCKACEVACKEWNLIPGGEDYDLLGMSFDNTGALGANTWRHVAFIEQQRPTVNLGMPGSGPPAPTGGHGTSMPTGTVGSASQTDTGSEDGPLMADEEGAQADFRWLMSSNVCKHCTHAGCLDVCPTGALFRTEFGTVVVQDDVCNGCGYCVPACPYGVIERRRGPAGALNVGIAQKCTLCYDRLGDGLQPACAQACPTASIQYGDVDELRERAERRRAELHEQGVAEARLYGHDPHDGVGGTGAFFLLLDEPEVYGLPPDPVVPTRYLPQMFNRATAAAGALLAAAALSFVGKR
ncbi:4Fe-4S dicluster domain-containing protein [Georgenia sp. H159]|uniref:4Fe-4S dicluster domain-containing protein n=1 Tax=Georgenia sp. H159 TaxID=3076115 RepID=UPI002D77CD5D|nr:4Fe-4S dicluster domain-containing protein [Georgenia sp. H159]